jgi:hypothetical protein
MYVRIVTATGATNLDDTIAFIGDKVLPDARQQKGFAGLSAAGDRAAGVITVLTVWETEADRAASESFSEKARNEALGIMGGGELRVEGFEQVLWEVGDVPPGRGAKLHIREVKMAPEKVDENLAFFKANVLPDIKATPGFLAVRQLIDRDTGEGRIGTLWADETSLSGALQRAEQRRDLAEGRVEFGEDRVLEVLIASR